MDAFHRIQKGLLDHLRGQLFISHDPVVDISMQGIHMPLKPQGKALRIMAL